MQINVFIKQDTDSNGENVITNKMNYNNCNWKSHLTAYRCRIPLNTCDGLPVLGIKCLVDLVKQVERRRVALLNGKDESQRDERFLSTRQLLHVPHLGFVTSERHLHQHSDIHLVTVIT